MDPWIALAQAGPAAMLLVFIVAGAVAFVRGIFVPGWLYRQERAEREKAELREAKNAATLAKLVRIFGQMNGRAKRNGG